MKKTFLSAFAFFVLFLTTGMYYEYGLYSPVFMKIDDLRQSVSYHQGKREMIEPGKIYYSHPYIYVNERYRGVHVINNSNPANPVVEGFITAPGCLDMAVKGDIMYVDNAVDLVAFNLKTRQVTERISGAFPEPSSPAGGINYYSKEGFVLVGWKKR